MIHNKDYQKTKDFITRLIGKKNCSNFIQHKGIWIDPRLIAKKIKDVEIFVWIQKPTELIYNGPEVYHFGISISDLCVANAINVGSMNKYCLKYFVKGLNMAKNYLKSCCKECKKFDIGITLTKNKHYSI